MLKLLQFRSIAILLAFVALIPPVHGNVQITLAPLGAAAQSGPASAGQPASLAIDGSTSTYSETPAITNAFWEVELRRAVRVSRIEIVAPSGSTAPNGLILRIYDLRDRTLFQATVSGLAPGGTWATNLPAPVRGRIVRLGLENGLPNGAGQHKVALAEVRVFGDPSPSHGPVALAAAGTVFQSSTNLPPGNAIDGQTGTLSATQDLPNSFWMLTLDRTQRVERIEIISPPGSDSARMQNLTVRLLGNSSNTLAVTTVFNPGSGNNWTYTPPPGTAPRSIRIGLENGAVNGQGNFIVSLAEVAVHTAVNWAAGAESYSTRNHDGIPPAYLGNDDFYITAATASNVGAYWEVDLGQTRALYHVRTVAANTYQVNMTHATVRLYDENHSSVWSEHHPTNSLDVFDIQLPGPVFARYVRVGVENKERTTTGPSWAIGMKEVQTFGRFTNEVGISTFSATSTQIVAGASTQLNWQETEMYSLSLHPHIGSVGSNTAPTGFGSRTVSPTNSTEYVLIGTNYSGLFARHLTVKVHGQSLPPRITEFMALNRLTLRDGNRNASDWIEIHNPNNEPMPLGGYGLSDNPAQPMKWVFPAGTTLAPHAYLIVFASDSNQAFDAAGNLHASFALSQAGESVVLTAPDGVTTLDAILNYPAQREDLAYGRTLDGEWKFLDPTPGGVNAAPAYDGWLAPPVFSHIRGWYTNAFSLTITHPDPNAELLFSLNGTEPSLPYFGPLEVSSTLPVRAGVQRPGFKPPRTVTHTYLFMNSILAQPLMNSTYTQGSTWTNRLRQGLRELPTLAVSVPPAPPVVDSERVEREASVEIFWPDSTAPLQVNCGITHFGGGFGTGTGNPYAKKSYQLKFRADYGASKLEAPLFRGFDRTIQARESFDEIDLHAGNHDMSGRGFYLSHLFAADTMLDMGSLNPHGRYVHLYINGVYWGQYDAHERLTDAFLGEYLGGRTEDYLTVRGNDNGPGGNFVLGVPEPPDREPWEYMLANRGSYAAIKDRLDVTNLIDFMLVWNWGNAENEFRAAGPKTPGAGGFKFWLADADGHLRNQSGVSSALTRDGTLNTGPGLIFGALFAESHPDFRMLLKDRIFKHFFYTGAMTPGGNLKRMNARMTEITNSMIAECARWGSMNGRTPANWLSDAQYARDQLLPYRSDNLMTFMRSRGWYSGLEAPTFNQMGGVVTNGFGIRMSGPGILRYTLDGSDPRLPGGGISPDALQWTGTPIIVHSNTIVTVRVWNSGGWSALVQLVFVPGPIKQPVPGDLVFTEIHYNPPGSDDYEFLEIHNAGTNMLDLTNVRITDGVDFLFPVGFYLPPGALALVTENTAAFDERYRTPGSPYYQSNLLVAGSWTGQLSNSGERLALIASNGVELAAVTYGTGGSWPSRADGQGSSLELRNPSEAVAVPASLNSHLARPANWRSSTFFHGTPGRLDVQPRDLVISEVLTHTDIGVDWIEIQNLSAESVNLSGFYLSDSYSQPFRHALSGTIPANGFLLRSATQLGFGFSELGSDVLLIHAAGTNILRFADTTDVPAAAREEPFGRYIRSDGVVDFTELRSITPGAENALPRIGPVVISEIMYNPTGGKAEFVELVNIASTNVLLYDPLRPTNRWELSDAVEFTFPAGQQIAPGQVILISATDPSTFRAQYGVSPSIPVYGPWTGALNNAGETVRLRHPGVPEPDGFVPYYRVDRVRYEPVAPWPVEADGAGPSLERVTLEGYGNDPSNWEASDPGGTPGTFTGNRPPGVATDQETTFPEGTLATFTVHGSDPDMPWQEITVSATNLPDGSTFNPATRQFSWLTGEIHGPGVYPLQFIANDNGVVSMVHTQVILLTIEEVNLPPSLQPLSNLQHPALVPLTIDVQGSDPDLPAQSLSYGASGLPQGMDIDFTTGRISGSPSLPGLYEITVFVADDYIPALQAERHFELVVTEPFQLEWTHPSGGSDPQWSFWTLAGETYEVYYTPQLDPADWQLVQRIESAGGGLHPIPSLPSNDSEFGFIRVLWIRE